MEALTNYFKRFGSIINIKVDQSSKLAIVEFQNSHMANNAVNSKKVLFGDKKILITLDPNATIPQSPKKEESISQLIATDSKNRVQNQEIKIKDDLTTKLKFLIEIKRFMCNDENKKEILKLINEVKESLKKGVLNENMTKLLQANVIDLNINHSQFMNTFAQTTLENIPVLRTTLEVFLKHSSISLNKSKLKEYGKLEYLKPNPKDKKIELKYISPESALKVKILILWKQ